MAMRNDCHELHLYMESSEDEFRRRLKLPQVMTSLLFTALGLHRII